MREREDGSSTQSWHALCLVEDEGVALRRRVIRGDPVREAAVHLRSRKGHMTHETAGWRRGLGWLLHHG